MSLLLTVGAMRGALDSLATASVLGPSGKASSLESLPPATALSLIILYVLLLVFGFCAPAINRFINRSKESSLPKHLSWPYGIRSFAGGMAASYVFILLIPEMQLFNSEIRVPFFNTYSWPCSGC